MLYKIKCFIGKSNKENNKGILFSIHFIRLHSYLIISILLLLINAGCKKLVEIGPPKSSITTSETFSDSVDAASAIAGAYSKLFNQGSSLSFGNGQISLTVGTSADELLLFGGSSDQFNSNALTSDNAILYNSFWTQPYSIIYQLNASIDGLQASTGVSTAAKNQFIGESKFLRAFCYFYLVNLFGDVPYVTSIAYAQTASAPRTSKTDVYKNIINDLIDAQSLLPVDYVFSGNERIRANKWAATALLARVYLYKGDYANAEIQANAIISNTALFGLNPDLNKVFYKNNNLEPILQWQLNSSLVPYTATPEGFNFIPQNSSYNPKCILTNQLLNAFEINDQRKTAWLYSYTYAGTVYTYPNKYKIGSANRVLNGTTTEYYTVLRVAEQYLIRAEARAQLDKLSGAIADVDTIRSRAKLPNITAVGKAGILSAIAQERRIELFAEWGHRWLDLKRTGAVDSVMTIATPLKGGGTIWQSFQQWYPIPLTELQRDPYLIQNLGYQ